MTIPTGVLACKMPPGYKLRDATLPLALCLTRVRGIDSSLDGYGLCNQFEFTKLMLAAHPAPDADWSSSFWVIKTLDWSQSSLSQHTATSVSHVCGQSQQGQAPRSSTDVPDESFDFFDASFLKHDRQRGVSRTGQADNAFQSATERPQIPASSSKDPAPDLNALFPGSDEESLSDGGGIGDEIEAELRLGEGNLPAEERQQDREQPAGPRQHAQKENANFALVERTLRACGKLLGYAGLCWLCCYAMLTLRLCFAAYAAALTEA